MSWAKSKPNYKNFGPWVKINELKVPLNVEEKCQKSWKLLRSKEQKNIEKNKTWNKSSTVFELEKPRRVKLGVSKKKYKFVKNRK